MTGNEADAWDASQDALVSIVRGLPRFDGRSAFGTWAYRIAANACLDELRRRGRRALPGLPVDHDDEPRVPAATSVAIDGLADRLAIDTALAQVPEPLRTAVILRDLCDLEYADIAEALDIPPGTVRSRIARGRSLLAALLADGNPDAGGERPSPRTRTDR
jgi:RNA polymerase sigma-70 factor (ECF subfamily)